MGSVIVMKRVKDITERIEGIERVVQEDRNYLRARTLTDQLYHDVLWEIAENRCRSPRAWAKEVLTTALGAYGH